MMDEERHGKENPPKEQSNNAEGEIWVDRNEETICVSEGKEFRRSKTETVACSDADSTTDEKRSPMKSIPYEHQSWKKKVARNIRRIISDDWMFLILLGVSVALLSFSMDFCIGQIVKMRVWIYDESAFINDFLAYVAWIMLCLLLVIGSAFFSHIVAAQAIGSGIPELKTMLRGVLLKEYLTFKTLVSKVVGLTMSLGSGLPIGKEGPFVHISSIVATLLNKALGSFRSINENENREAEMLAAACAVGVACTFGAPVGGVLFSIEVTTVHFAVRDYWRGFFSAGFSAISFGLLGMVFVGENEVQAFSATHFPDKNSYQAKELIAYAVLGIACGLLGTLYVFMQGRILEFIITNQHLKRITSYNRFIFPAVSSFVIATITFPQLLGHYTQSRHSSKEILSDLFTNFTWSDPDMNILDALTVGRWSSRHVPFFLGLTIFTVYYFLCSAVAICLPIPNGVFSPLLLIGAGFGRLFGEIMALWFDYESHSKVFPGSYSVLGAAALSGAVTQTVSTAVIIFELTGQITYRIPILLGVSLANAVSTCLELSIYDMGIKVKNLPFLPNLLPMNSSVHNVRVKDFMVHSIPHISMQATYREIQNLLVEYHDVRVFPIVDDEESLTLLGSISRRQLEADLENKVGAKARKLEARRRKLARKICIGLDRNNKHHSANELRGALFPSMSPPPLNLGECCIDVDAVPTAAPPRNKNAGLFAWFYLQTKSRVDKAAHQRKWLRLGYEHKLDSELDLTGDERKQWEEACLDDKPDFSKLNIDSAPLQLTEQTSLFQAHELFSLLGLCRAFVTWRGRLVGMVTLNELREAIERAKYGYVFDKQVYSPGRSSTKDAINPRTNSESNEHKSNGMSEHQNGTSEPKAPPSPLHE